MYTIVGFQYRAGARGGGGEGRLCMACGVSYVGQIRA